jgi:hypothetical protein
MDKLPKVEYDFDDGYLPLYTQEKRPMETIDAIFERKMSKRLSKFHAKPIDRT